MNKCIDCGTATTGKRCVKHRFEQEALNAARALSLADRELLRLRGEGLSLSRIGTRMGITPQRVFQRLRDAERRQALLATAPEEEVPWPFRVSEDRRIRCYLRGVDVPESECVNGCPAPEMKVLCEQRGGFHG